MKLVAIFAASLFLVPGLALAKHPRVNHAAEVEARERAAAEAAVVAERARVEAEAAAAKAKAEADAKAAKAREYVTVHVAANYRFVRLESLDADQKTVLCSDPCVAKLHVGTRYRVSAPGMLSSDPVIVGEQSKVLRVQGKSRARLDGGIAALAVGVVGISLGGALIEEGTKDESDFSRDTQMDLVVAGLISTGIGVVIGVTGLVLLPGSTKVGDERRPDQVSRQASRPHLTPSGALAF